MIVNVWKKIHHKLAFTSVCVKKSEWTKRLDERDCTSLLCRQGNKVNEFQADPSCFRSPTQGTEVLKFLNNFL